MYTEEQIAEYLNADGSCCPVCGSLSIEAGPIQADGRTAWSLVTCRNCGEEWVDIYKLVSAKQRE